MKECGEGGWIAAPFPFDLGGQQLPLMISGACRFILSAANYSASVYPFLTTGAAHLVLTFASREMVETYVPKMFSGEWQGTMALTEPEAGSSLSDITTGEMVMATGSKDAATGNLLATKVNIFTGERSDKFGFYPMMHGPKR